MYIKKSPMLKQTFIKLLEKYTDKNDVINELWNEIEVNYSKKNRYYHTLQHLENLLYQLTEIKDKINNWDTILFTLYYHDIVYNPLKKNNEEKSAEFAEKRMSQILIPNPVIKNCKAQILATKDHFESKDSDTNFFTDADLSVLGQEWEEYSQYFKNVRKEYSIFPDIIYNSGRKKVLKHFLEMKKVFKTEYFFSKLEQQAKKNLQKEFELL
jgi:predicted metal-dependent HD superfamily phosphohydrolase